MGRRRSSSLDEDFEKWARWSIDYGISSAGPLSILAKMIDSHGCLVFGDASGSCGPLEGIELAIESSVMNMSKTDLLAVDVLRLEYAAGWLSVVNRRNIKNYDPVGCGQKENAHALDISIRTYRRKLAKARGLVDERLLTRAL